MMNHPHPDDQEAAMARADLYKTANYSFKLFKMIQDGDQLEGWVQAKITKAADYVASVYHYLEYEMKFSEYGSKIENSDMYTEAVRKEFKKKLTEAKVKLEKLKEKNQKDLDETFDDKAKVGDKKKTRTGELEKTSTGVKHTNTDYKDDGESEQKSGKGKASHAKGQSAAEKKSQAPKLKQSPKSAKTWGMKDSEKFDNRDKEVKEGMAPMNPDGASAPPPKGKDGQYPVITSGPHKGKRWSPKTPGPTNPAMKESAGKKECPPMSHVKKMCQDGKTVAEICKMHPDCDQAELKQMVADCKKKMDEGMKSPKDMPKRGEKLGKEGNAFGKAVRDAKANGDKTMSVGGKTMSVKEASKPDFLDMDKDGNKKEPMKKAVADKKKNPFAKVKETAISGAPQRSGIPATAKTSVPGMRATPQDLKKAGASAALGEGKCNRTARGKSCPVHGMKECGSSM